jgi:hypothetical protein
MIKIKKILLSPNLPIIGFFSIFIFMIAMYTIYMPLFAPKWNETPIYRTVLLCFGAVFWFLIPSYSFGLSIYLFFKGKKGKRIIWGFVLNLIWILIICLILIIRPTA